MHKSPFERHLKEDKCFRLGVRYASVQTSEASSEHVIEGVGGPGLEHLPVQPIVIEPEEEELASLRVKFQDREFVRVGKTGKCTTCFNGFECELY